MHTIPMIRFYLGYIYSLNKYIRLICGDKIIRRNWFEARGTVHSIQYVKYFELTKPSGVWAWCLFFATYNAKAAVNTQGQPCRHLRVETRASSGARRSVALVFRNTIAMSIETEDATDADCTLRSLWLTWNINVQLTLCNRKWSFIRVDISRDSVYSKLGIIAIENEAIKNYIYIFIDNNCFSKLHSNISRVALCFFFLWKEKLNVICSFWIASEEESIWITGKYDTSIIIYHLWYMWLAEFTRSKCITRTILNFNCIFSDGPWRLN